MHPSDEGGMLDGPMPLLARGVHAVVHPDVPHAYAAERMPRQVLNAPEGSLSLMERIQSFISDLFARLGSYPWWEVGVELALIWLLVFGIVRFVQGTRAAGALKGLLLVIAGATVLAVAFGRSDTFQRIGLLYDRGLALLAIALVVIFQPELRRALVRLGETRLLRSSPSELAKLVDPVMEACTFLSKARFGGLIVIERELGLRGLVEGGTDLDAEVSARLLQSIFYPGSALHDLAVVIRGPRIRSAGVQLPLADPTELPDPSLGSRHRAALGLSKESDAVVIVVSEETGAMRLALRGKLIGPLEQDQLRARLIRELRAGSRGDGDDGPRIPEPNLADEADEAYDRMHVPSPVTAPAKATSKDAQRETHKDTHKDAPTDSRAAQARAGGAA